MKKFDKLYNEVVTRPSGNFGKGIVTGENIPVSELDLKNSDRNRIREYLNSLAELGDAEPYRDDVPVSYIIGLLCKQIANLNAKNPSRKQEFLEILYNILRQVI